MPVLPHYVYYIMYFLRRDRAYYLAEIRIIFPSVLARIIESSQLDDLREGRSRGTVERTSIRNKLHPIAITTRHC